MTIDILVAVVIIADDFAAIHILDFVWASGFLVIYLCWAKVP